MKRFVFGGCIAAGLTAAQAAYADHYVYSPKVEEGVLELETRFHRNVDHAAEKDGAESQIYEVEYGVNSWWQTAIFGEVEKEPGEDRKYTATGWENIFQLTPQGKYWLDAGLYVEYAHGTRGEPDEIETKLLLEKYVSPLVLTANLIVNKQMGRNADRGIGFEYALRANYPWRRELQFGVEAFGETGHFGSFEALSEQDHLIGPVLSGKFNVPYISGSFGYQAGYLFGLTPGSANGEIKAVLEYEIPF